MSGPVVAGLRDDPRLDLVGNLAVVQPADEILRPQQIAFRVPDPEQGLDADDGARLQVDHRLVVQQEPASFQGVQQHRLVDVHAGVPVS